LRTARAGSGTCSSCPVCTSRRPSRSAG
jgi:hypothetical protein